MKRSPLVSSVDKYRIVYSLDGPNRTHGPVGDSGLEVVHIDVITADMWRWDGGMWHICSYDHDYSNQIMAQVTGHSYTIQDHWRIREQFVSILDHRKIDLEERLPSI